MENFENASRTNEPVFDKNDLVERNLIQPVSPETVRYVDTEGAAPTVSHINEYHSESQEKLDHIRTIMVSNKAAANNARYARNSSNVSVDTDMTRKHKNHESGFVSGYISKH